MQRFYEKYGDDAEELEHRIARIEASMEGCNGLTQDEKIQKTAENVFELTCAQERSYDALRREIKLSREEYMSECADLKTTLKTGLDELSKKIEDSGCDCHASSVRHVHGKFVATLISKHPVITLNAFIFMLILVFISGHFDQILNFFGGK